MLKKVIVWGAIAFLVFFVAFRPGAALHVVRALGSTAGEIFQGFGDLFGVLAG